MRRPATLCLIGTAVTLAVGAATAGQAFAHKLLTFYANGAPVALGSPYAAGFELKTTDPVEIAIPASKLLLSCPADPEFAIFGWFESNGSKDDVIGTNGYNTGPVRDCSGHEFGGLLFDGTLHIKTNGHVVVGENEYLHYLPQLNVDNCYFFGKLKGTISLPGLFTTTLSGTMRSRRAGCPRVADVKVGPLNGLYDSYLVEGRLSGS